MTNNTNTFLYQPGLFNANSYLVSGIPFLTGSSITGSQESVVRFDKVTRSITVINTSGSLLVSFNSITSSNVSGGHHYVTLPAVKDSITFNVKCSSLYISLANGSPSGSYELVAELTNINANQMFALTGSGLTV